MSHAAGAAAPNRLASATSPYLLQHAHNPVDWYTWGDEAFATARSTGKPILLSIGYSACHWCHVMAHESFEDKTTAVLMNQHFINIKVDREERPDIDRIYQLAHQLLTRRGGGWPLTMFLTHDDQRPFFGGTYFPPSPRYGMPGFSALLERVAQYYRERQEELRAQSQALVEALQSIDETGSPTDWAPSDAPLHKLREQLESRFDRTHGGWSPAPKFPHAGILTRLLRTWRASADSETPDLQALFMATFTMKHMADGGLYDQLGGGFSRYSVDERWEIPHFEKMLYDNGALLSVFADAALATGDGYFAKITAETAEFLIRDLRSPEGGFYSSLDADSEGEEGRFYVWTPDEVESLLSSEDAALISARYGLDHEPNFEGRWHLVVRAELEALANNGNHGSSDARALEHRLDAARTTLLAQRATRIWPGRDDKLLTSWNALAIKGLADAARSLGREDLAQAAIRALSHIRAAHWRDGRLLATSREGVAHLPAYLDDHAFLIDAILALITVRFRMEDLAFAMQLAEGLLEHFEDREHGGFFFTAHDHETLIHRSRVFSDDAMPSGNAIAAFALQRLGYLLAEPRYLAAAERTLRATWSALSEQPLAHVHLTTALEEYLSPPLMVILRGKSAELDLWQRELQRVYRPNVSVISIPDDAVGLPPALQSKLPGKSTLAYLCRGSTCNAPYEDLATLLANLSANHRR